jgi:hypothetical protein
VAVSCAVAVPENARAAAAQKKICLNMRLVLSNKKVNLLLLNFLVGKVQQNGFCLC